MGTRILIVRLGSLGDVILTSPTVLNLKINYPDSHICYLTRTRFTPVVSRFDGVDEVTSLPDQIDFFSYLKQLHHLDCRNFDIVVDLHGNFRSWLSRRVVVGGLSVVYPKRRVERRRIARSHIIPKSWPHTIDLYNDVLSQLGKKTFCRRPAMLVDSGLPAGSSSRRTVLIAPGAAHDTKKWGTDRFAKVAGRLIEEKDVMIKWVVLSSESSAEDLSPQIRPDRCEILTDRPLEELIGHVSSANLVLANDSGVGHLGSATGTPVLALFGPTHPSLGFAPRGLRDGVIEVDEDCRPCSIHGKSPCFRDDRYCFTRISEETVFERCLSVLESGKGERAVFLDRDGTLIANKHYLSDPEGVELENGVVPALRRLRDAGFKLVAVSNQSGVARGMFGIEAVESVNRRMLEMLATEGVELDALYYCPHHFEKGLDPRYKIDCDCRKPGPGMAEQAAWDLGLDLRRSVVVGDSLVDLNLARTIGATPALVRTGHGKVTESGLSESSSLSGLIIGDTLEDIADQLFQSAADA